MCVHAKVCGCYVCMWCVCVLCVHVCVCVVNVCSVCGVCMCIHVCVYMCDGGSWVRSGIC